jgi:hypothetical protein
MAAFTFVAAPVSGVSDIEFTDIADTGVIFFDSVKRMIDLFGDGNW